MHEQNESLNDKMKKAVKAAIDYFTAVFSTLDNKVRKGSLRIEKISYYKDKNQWEIVIGYIIASDIDNNELAQLFADEGARREKTTIIVNGGTFEVEDYES